MQTSGGGSQPGYELLDESKLGASQFQQQVTYQRALEGEVAKSLSGVEGVSNPNVQIVMPQDDLFADEASPATAAIQLGNASDTLAPGAVRGMAQLTASSVKGLKTENVTITDSTGAVLWPSDEAGGTGGGSSSKASAEARYARQKETAINAMLASTLGPGKAQVKINADLNMDETTRGPADRRRQGHAARRPPRRPRTSRAAAPPRARHRRHRLQRPDLLGQQRLRRPATARTSPRRARPSTSSPRR